MNSAAVSYDGETVRLAFPERFMENAGRKITADSYAAALKRHTIIPDHIRTLIYKLFKAGAITQCEIGYGRWIDFKLATRKGGRDLLDVARLQAFASAFKGITGQDITVTQLPGGTVRSQTTPRGSGFEGLADTIAGILTQRATVLDVMIWS